MTIGLYIAVVIIGYLIGSIPFGLMISRTITGKDLTKVGSGKTGMTNVLRTAGKKAAALALILDMAKGAGAVLIAGVILGDGHTSGQALAAMVAIAGHSWSIFLKFKGGRGVATFIGGLFALYWPAALFGGAIMIIVGAISRYMSLGSITGAVSAFILLIVLFIVKSYSVEFLTYTVYTMICAIFIFFMHKDNILRLVSGTERKLGEKARAEDSTLPGHQE